MPVSLGKVKVMMARTPPKTQSDCIENLLGLPFLVMILIAMTSGFPRLVPIQNLSYLSWLLLRSSSKSFGGARSSLLEHYIHVWQEAIGELFFGFCCI